MQRWYNNLFGSIVSLGNVRGGGKDFIPRNNRGGVFELTGKGSEASWLGLKSIEMQKYAYMYCAPLASVIDGIASADSNGRIKIVKDDDTREVSQSGYAKRMKKLLKRPNPMQTWTQFRAQQVTYKKSYGFCPIFPVMPAGMSFKDDPSFAQSLWNLPPWLCRLTPTRKIFGQLDQRGIIETLEINILGQTITLQGDQFFTIDDGYMVDENNSYMTPMSKMVGLDWNVSNILAAMEADNVLLRKKGPLGFVSHDAAAVKDSVAGYIPMTKMQKQELQQSLSQYGMSWNQFQYVISRQAVKWNPMSFNAGELQTKETVKQGIDGICDRYNYPRVLLANVAAGTPSSQETALKYLYQNNVVPDNYGDMEEYNYYFKMQENGIEITTTFDHLPVLQEDANRANLALKAKTDATSTQYLMRIITLNRMRTIMGEVTVEGDDKYYDGPPPGIKLTDNNAGNGQTTQNEDRANQS